MTTDKPTTIDALLDSHEAHTHGLQLVLRAQLAAHLEAHGWTNIDGVGVSWAHPAIVAPNGDQMVVHEQIARDIQAMWERRGFDAPKPARTDSPAPSEEASS